MSGCFECGAEPTQVHHVIPRALGGTRTVPLCRAHHRMVHGHALTSSYLSRRARRRVIGPIELPREPAPVATHWTEHALSLMIQRHAA